MSILYLFFFFLDLLLLYYLSSLHVPQPLNPSLCFRLISIGLLCSPEHHDVFLTPYYICYPLSCFTTIFVYVYLNHRRKKKESLFPWIHCCCNKIKSNYKNCERPRLSCIVCRTYDNPFYFYLFLRSFTVSPHTMPIPFPLQNNKT